METTHVPSERVGALETTVNLFAFILMWISLFATGSLFFNVINHYFPDPLSGQSYMTLSELGTSITYAIAAVIIALPLYLVSIRYWLTKFTSSVARVESRLSRFLTYVILLAVALTIVGDLISLLYNFLQGEFGARFAFKSLTILVLAIHTAFFYYNERRVVQYKMTVRTGTFRYMFMGSMLLALAAIILGFVVGGSPMTQRARRIDDIRVQNMEQISSSVSSFVWDNGRLPSTLDELARNNRYGYNIVTADPVTKAPYIYRLDPSGTQSLSYELCATFEINATVSEGAYTVPVSKWVPHDVGQKCVTEEATKSPEAIKAQQAPSPLQVK